MRTSSFGPAAKRLTIDGMAALGLTRHEIMGIRYTDGGNTNPPAPAPANAAPNPVPAAPAPGTPAPGAPAPTPAPAPSDDTSKLDAADLAARNRTLAAENKTRREAAEAAEQRAKDAETKTAAILKAAGLNPDGTLYTEIDPAKVAAERTAAQSEADATKRENLVLRIGNKPEISANTDRLLDSNTFTNALKALKSDDREGVESLLKEWVEKDPSYKIVATAASSGGTTHTGNTPPAARKSMQDAVSSKIAPK